MTLPPIVLQQLRELLACYQAADKRTQHRDKRRALDRLHIIADQHWQAILNDLQVAQWLADNPGYELHPPVAPPLDITHRVACESMQQRMRAQKESNDP